MRQAIISYPVANSAFSASPHPLWKVGLGGNWSYWENQQILDFLFVSEWEFGDDNSLFGENRSSTLIDPPLCSVPHRGEGVKQRKSQYDLSLFYCIVLKGWSLLPNALWPFQIYYAPPNLGITRTWVCQLNFAQRPIFSFLRFFSEPEISDWGPPA